MGGENLLDQRRAGARHADDEDRRRRPRPLVGEPVEQRGGESGGDLSEELFRRVGAVGRDRALHPVAFVQMTERRRRVAEVEVGLAERKMQRHAGRVSLALLRREQSLHRGDRRIVGGEFHQFGAPAHRGRRLWVERQRLGERRPRFVLSAEGLHRAGALGPQPVLFGALYRDGAVQGADPLLVAPFGQQQRGDRVFFLDGLLRVARRHRLEPFNVDARFVDAVERNENSRAHAERQDVVGRFRQQIAEPVQRRLALRPPQLGCRRD